MKSINSTIFVFAISLGAVFLVPEISTAQEDRGVQEPVDGDPCPMMTAEECFWGGGPLSLGSGGTHTKCTKSYCAACGLNEKLTASVCSWQYGSWGYCTCKGTSTVYTDKYGNKWARCDADGYCSYR
jgi:hypothetical protein